MAKLVTSPNPVLREKSQSISKLDKKTLSLIKQVEATLRNRESPRGVGLSAVQIGKPVRIFSILLPTSGKPDDKAEPVLKTFINPEIVKVSKEKTFGPNQEKPILEGCLSIPSIWGPVKRHKWLKLRYQTENGTWKMEKFKDFPARVIQHELDHLNGILFADHSVVSNLPLYESRGEELVQISM